jgi:Family of unknown function (DUF5335)
MRNRLVPHAEWFTFFRDFTERRAGHPVILRVMNPKLGSQVEAHDLPLMGLVAGATGRGPISIHVGDSTTGNIEHEVPDPVSVWVEVSPEGEEAAIEIESEDGTKTILEFETVSAQARVAAPPSPG